MIQRNKNFWTNDQGRHELWQIKWSNETVRIVSSWRHVKYFGKLKWDRVHSMLIHLSGSTAPHEKPYMSPQVSSMKCEVGLWRKFTVWKHLFSSRSMYCISSLPCAILTVSEAECVSTLIFLVYLVYPVHTSIWTDLAKPGFTMFTSPGSLKDLARPRP